MNIYEASKKLGKSSNHILLKLKKLGIKPIGKIKHRWTIERLVNDYDEQIILNLWNTSTKKTSTNSVKKTE